MILHLLLYCIGELWHYLNQFRKHKLAAEHLYPFIIQSHKDARYLPFPYIILSPEAFYQNSILFSISFTFHFIAKQSLILLFRHESQVNQAIFIHQQNKPTKKSLSKMTANKWTVSCWNNWMQLNQIIF